MWNKCFNSLPRAGDIVRAKSASGMEQLLYYNNNLWWLADGSMYVYYEVVEWRYI